MLYIAFLMDRFHYIPYRDIFDMNMPGAYFTYYLIGRLFGYTDIGIRCAEMLILLLVLGINGLWLKNISKIVAWCGSVLWGLLYLSFGPGISLQRESIILLPVMIAIYIYSKGSDNRILLRYGLTGLFFGIASTIKPPAAIGLLFILFLEFSGNKKDFKNNYSWLRKNIMGVLVPITAGFLIPVLFMFLYLWFSETIVPFFDIVFNYWPLYTHLTGNHVTISGGARILYLIKNYIHLGSFRIWLIPFITSLYTILFLIKPDNRQKKQIRLMIGLVFCYSLYPIFSGQFWDYHWILFLFFIVQVSSLCLIDQLGSPHIIKKWLPTTVFIAFVFIIFISISPISLINPPSPKNGRVDEINSFLMDHKHPGDKVQPLDWTGGAIHAMLISNTQISTPFIYDFHFYHHISSPYIKNLRNKFISEMKETKPRFLIKIFDENKPWVSGSDTSREFLELDELLDNDYEVILNGNGYLIYELNTYSYKDH